MLKIMTFLILLAISMSTLASGRGLTIRDTYYCGDDFSIMMSNGERWVFRKQDLGEKKLDHFISMALFMVATNKKTGNTFPGTPISWCGNPNVRPIRIFSFINN